MTPDEAKHLNEVLDRLHLTIKDATLAALRQHSAEQVVECVPGVTIFKDWQLPEHLVGGSDLRQDIAKTVEHLKPTTKPAEVDGERAVWAQAFQSAYSFCWAPTADQQFITQKSSERADMAVAEFRARYK